PVFASRFPGGAMIEHHRARWVPEHDSNDPFRGEKVEVRDRELGTVAVHAELERHVDRKAEHVDGVVLKRWRREARGRERQGAHQGHLSPLLRDKTVWRISRMCLPQWLKPMGLGVVATRLPVARLTRPWIE